MDALHNAPIAKTEDQWLKNPSHFDLKGVDTKLVKIESLNLPISSEPLSIGNDISVVYDPQLQSEAETMPRGKIHVGKKFVEINGYSPETAKRILVHEVGHVLQMRDVPFSRENMTIFEKHPIYRGNWFEGIAESFAEFLTDKNALKERSPEMFARHKELQAAHPQYYELGEKLLNSKLAVND